MNGQIDTSTPERDAFHLQTKALFGGGFKAQLDLASCAHDALPWKAIRWLDVQQAGDGAVIPRISGGRCNLPVCGNSSFRNGKDDTPEGCVPQFITSRTAGHHNSFSPS